MFDSQVSHALVVSLTKGIIDLGKPVFLNIELFDHYFLFYIKGSMYLIIKSFFEMVWDCLA
jgi:hypothetical protein